MPEAGETKYLHSMNVAKDFRAWHLRQSWGTVTADVCRFQLAKSDFAKSQAKHFGKRFPAILMYIVEYSFPWRKKADQHRDAYREAHKRAIVKFVKQFRQEFGTADGQIDWGKVLVLNSGKPAGKERGDTETKNKKKIKRW
ncbi:MAG TPA: hypothetical protein VHV32_00180 [Candidatus Angelobacter sp.]|jgi:hypothetical protein|nr:hypothetical protein [Candidatus Angelobacter sp.]